MRAVQILDFAYATRFSPTGARTPPSRRLAATAGGKAGWDRSSNSGELHGEEERCAGALHRLAIGREPRVGTGRAASDRARH